MKKAEPTECRLVLMFAGATYTQTFPKDKRDAMVKAIDDGWSERFKEPSAREKDVLVLGTAETPNIAKLDLTRLVGWWIEDITPEPPKMPDPVSQEDRDYKRLMSEYLRESIKFFKRDSDGEDWREGR